MAGSSQLLPQFTTSNKDLTLLQSGWAAIINAVLRKPYINGIVLKNQPLVTGSNTINTTLGRKLQGWSIVRLRGAASIYDTQDANITPDLTLLLTSSANVSADILVF